MRPAVAAAALTAALAASPCAAMELVVFAGDRTLAVLRYEERGDQAVMELPGGGRLGCPKSRVVAHIEGYVPPPDDPEPSRALPAEMPYRESIARYCQEYGMDCKLVAAVVRVESNFNPRAVSPKGAQGLMQLMPSVQRDEGVRDPFDPEQNLRAGIRYLKKMLEACRGDLGLALAAYNAGLTRVKAAETVPRIRETEGYVARILALVEEM